MTRQIRVGGVPIGGGAPVTIQSMTNTRTDDVSATAEQIKRLAAAGCEIVRVAVPDLAAARAVGAIRERSPIPLVADIHFDYRLALECVAAGCDKVRINPGNIGGEDRVKAVADACRQKGIPIRIGVNGGSLEKPILAKYGGAGPGGGCPPAGAGRSDRRPPGLPAPGGALRLSGRAARGPGGGAHRPQPAGGAGAPGRLHHPHGQREAPLRPGRNRPQGNRILTRQPPE